MKKFWVWVKIAHTFEESDSSENFFWSPFRIDIREICAYGVYVDVVKEEMQHNRDFSVVYTRSGKSHVTNKPIQFWDQLIDELNNIKNEQQHNRNSKLPKT